MQQSTLLGLLSGMVLGGALAFGDFGQMLTVAFFGAIGVIVVKVLQGDVDLAEWFSAANRKKSE